MSSSSRSHRAHVRRAISGVVAAASAALVLAGCGDSDPTGPNTPAEGPPEGRQVAPSGWLVYGAPIAWSDATDEILAMGEVLAMPPTGNQALHGIKANTGAYRVVDHEGTRLVVSESGTHVYFTWVDPSGGPHGTPEPQLVERSLLSGARRVWSEGVRVVLSPDDSLLAYSTAPWGGMIDSLVVEPLAGGLPIAAVPGVMIPLAFSPDATQLLIGNGSYASPDHRVLTFADGSLAPLSLGIPPGAVAFEPPFWDARGLLVFHVSGGIDSTIATFRNVTTGIDTVLLRAAEGCLGLTVAWSRDGRYAALFTQKVITVPDQQTPGREVSVWVLDTVVPGVRRIAYTWDAVAGRPLQDYAGTFSPDGTEFAWEAGRTLFLAPVDGER